MPPKHPIWPPKLLLAKSKDTQWKGTCTLTGHTAAVVTGVTTLLDEFGDGLIQQFGLSQDFATLRATARLAAFLHDLGKANDHFQAVVHHLKQPRQQPQLMRHEAVSVLLAWELRPWLSTGAGDVLVAIATYTSKKGDLEGQEMLLESSPETLEANVS